MKETAQVFKGTLASLRCIYVFLCVFRRLRGVFRRLRGVFRWLRGAFMRIYAFLCDSYTLLSLNVAGIRDTLQGSSVRAAYACILNFARMCPFGSSGLG